MIKKGKWTVPGYRVSHFRLSKRGECFADALDRRNSESSLCSRRIAYTHVSRAAQTCGSGLGLCLVWRFRKIRQYLHHSTTDSALFYLFTLDVGTNKSSKHLCFSSLLESIKKTYLALMYSYLEFTLGRLPFTFTSRNGRCAPGGKAMSETGLGFVDVGMGVGCH